MKKEGLPVSYEFLLGLLNSNLFWFFIQKTGYVLRGGYYTFKTNYVSPFPFPDYSTLPKDVISKIENKVVEILRNALAGSDSRLIQVEIDKLICTLYGVDYDAICLALSN